MTFSSEADHWWRTPDTAFCFQAASQAQHFILSFRTKCFKLFWPVFCNWRLRADCKKLSTCSDVLSGEPTCARRETKTKSGVNSVSSLQYQVSTLEFKISSLKTLVPSLKSHVSSSEKSQVTNVASHVKSPVARQTPRFAISWPQVARPALHKRLDVQPFPYAPPQVLFCRTHANSNTKKQRHLTICLKHWPKFGIGNITLPRSVRHQHVETLELVFNTPHMLIIVIQVSINHS